MTKEKLMKLELPKWPRCVITGDPVTEEQALEIIRRTDCFFESFFSNDKELGEKIRETVGAPKWFSLRDSDNEYSYYYYWRKWADEWNFLNLNHLYNDYISSSFVQGCSGWCHPDGHIDYHFNIGKWPEVEEIVQDLEAISEAFPFVNLEVTLYDNEYCDEGTPLISFLLRNNKVELIDPSARNIHEELGRTIWKYSEKATEENFERILKQNSLGNDSEISFAQIEKWGNDFKDKHPEYFE